MADFFVVIPARYASTRLPGKPLQDIAGKSMIQRVYEQAKKSAATAVFVATDDQRIADAVEEFGGKVCLTHDRHNSGTDRICEVAQQQGWADDAIVVNVQGDEPLIPPEVIDQVAQNLANHSVAGVATLCEKITDIDTFLDPHVVKVIADVQELALYFSRAPVPWPRDQFDGQQKSLPDDYPLCRHIGIYSYRVSFLNQFVQWPPAPLEQLECLEQLRAMYHGVRIHVAEAVKAVPAGIDTPADLESARKLFTELSS